MARVQGTIAAPGLGQLRRDLAKIDKDLRRAMDRHIRDLAAEVRDEARRRAPVLTGRLQRSLRYSLRARGALIYSDLEYAPVLEYGGTIRPKGTPITIRGRAYMGQAVDDSTARVEEQLAQLLDAIAAANRFR